jgi:hypothetical protein
VNRRIITGVVVALALGGGFVGHASAAEDTTRHKICVLGPTPQAPDQEGICITWVDPTR